MISLRAAGGSPGCQVAGLSSNLCLPCPLVNLSTCRLVLPSSQLANRSTNQLVASSTQPSIQSSTQSSIQSSVIDSVICHRPSHLFRVAGGSPRWRVAGFSIQSSIQSSTQSSIQPSVQSSIQSSVIDSALRHLSSTQSSSTSGGRWQPQVAGGGCSVLPHRLSHLSSVIDSAICPRPSPPFSLQSPPPP
jgi:hypothetical protein